MGRVLLRSVLAAASFIFAHTWNHILHVLVFINHPIPHWLHMVQIFWLAGLGFSCSIVWYPLIKRSFMRVGTDMTGRLSSTISTGRREHIEITSSSHFRITTLPSHSTKYLAHLPADDFTSSPRQEVIIDV